MTPVQIGFVPLVDCAPLVAAHAKGFFRAQGVAVELRKIQSWPQLLSRMQDGTYQAAHLLATTPVLVAAGSADARCGVVTAWTLSSSANAITLSNNLWKATEGSAAALADWLRSNPSATPTLGIVHPGGTQELAVREWLHRGGVEVGERVKLVACPPQEMTRRLREGVLDGFCAGEPWNQRATSSKLGGIVALGSELMPGVPEKVLAVRRDWHEAEPAAHAAILRALSDASAWLEEPGNLEEASRLLADKNWVNTQEPLVRSALSRRLDAGFRRVVGDSGFLRFRGINEPDPSGFRTLLERLVWWGHLPPRALETDLDAVCLVDFHRRAIA